MQLNETRYDLRFFDLCLLCSFCVNCAVQVQLCVVAASIVHLGQQCKIAVGCAQYLENIGDRKMNSSHQKFLKLNFFAILSNFGIFFQPNFPKSAQIGWKHFFQQFREGRMLNASPVYVTVGRKPPANSPKIIVSSFSDCFFATAQAQASNIPPETCPATWARSPHTFSWAGRRS